MKLVDFSGAISETYRFELGVYKRVQPAQFGYFLVEALATKLPVSALHGAVANDVVARCDLATTVAVDLLASRRLA